MGLLSYADVKAQSKAVFKQFGESKWIPNAKENAKMERRDAREFLNKGLGKTALLCAMGPSLEGQVETIRKYRDSVDIVTCDKGFGALLEHGIKADYVLLCDANIQQKWLRPYIEETKDVSLLATPYASLEWTQFWKGPKYFYCNRDAIQSEEIFLDILGEKTATIPAGSNVSNAMLVFFTRCDENSRINYAGYGKYLMTGYDYSWGPETNYYAWTNPTPKRNYMHHRTLLGLDRKITFSSENLIFSAKWMTMYVKAFNIPAVNCSGRGLLGVNLGNLEDELKAIKTDPAHRTALIDAHRTLSRAAQNLDEAKAIFARAQEALTWQ